ncbi:hypothetical protein ABR738_07590 [Streptomyces sp. Edi4]|uniref:hypothetical protein n=1 Tax=Streptomyces sp. Edi4 TaxID=3162527 RepID=UPI00330607A0
MVYKKKSNTLTAYDKDGNPNTLYRPTKKSPENPRGFQEDNLEEHLRGAGKRALARDNGKGESVLNAEEVDKSETVCRVCGYSDGDLYRDGGGWPTGLICACCGGQSGIQDATLQGVREFRGYWLGLGAPWDSPSEKAERWDLLEQISNIEPSWR